MLALVVPAACADDIDRYEDLARAYDRIDRCVERARIHGDRPLRADNQIVTKTDAGW